MMYIFANDQNDKNKIVQKRVTTYTVYHRKEKRDIN